MVTQVSPLIGRIRADVEKRMEGLHYILSTAQEFPALKKALEVDPFTCYQVMKISTDTLEGVEQLSSMMNNCLLDDSSFQVARTTMNGKHHYHHLEWGNYDKRFVTGDEVIKALTLFQEQADYYKANAEAIECRKRHPNGVPIFSAESKAYFQKGRDAYDFMTYLYDLQEAEDDE